MQRYIVWCMFGWCMFGSHGLNDCSCVKACVLPFLQVPWGAMGELVPWKPPGGLGLGVRRAAPHVDLVAMVDALESCLCLEDGYKGQHMTRGWEDFAKTGKITREALQSNFIILHTLLGIKAWTQGSSGELGC